MTMTMTSILIKTSIRASLHDLVESNLTSLKSNTDRLLGTEYIWDVIADYATRQAKGAHSQTVADGYLPDEAALRELDRGEHIIAETTKFTYKAKIGKGTETFDRDKLADLLSKRHKIPAHKIRQLFDESKKVGRPRLSVTLYENGDPDAD